MSQINSLQYYETSKSLLSMLNNKKDDSLLSQLITDNETKYEKKMESMGFSTSNSSNSKYKAVASSETNLLDSMSKLESDDLYTAEEGQEYDNTGLLKAVGNFVTAYNSSQSSLTSCGGILYSKFSESFTDAYKENSESLNKIGITMGDDGKLVIDQDKLSSASADDIKAALGKNSTFITAVKEPVTAIDDIVDQALQASSTYTSTGSYLNF